MNAQSTSGNYPPAPLPAVGAVVLKSGAVLLVQRAKAPARGLWAIPGGSVQLGETLQAAAEREVLEETGVVIRAGEPVLVFDVIQRDDQGLIRFHYVIVDLVAEYLEGEPRPGDDATDARWITEDQLTELPVNPATRRLLAEKFDFGRMDAQTDGNSLCLTDS